MEIKKCVPKNHTDLRLGPVKICILESNCEHIQKWGWKVNEDSWVNFPDWQMRIYRNTENIYWIKPVHEQLKGYTKFANLPAEEKFALYHPKDIGRQERQNAFYETI